MKNKKGLISDLEQEHIEVECEMNMYKDESTKCQFRLDEIKDELKVLKGE